MTWPVRVPVGHLVESLTGRDKGQLYVVIGHGTQPFILVADGRNRKAANPKKKNVRHVKPVRSIAENVAYNLTVAGKVTDEKLRQAISNHVKRMVER